MQLSPQEILISIIQNLFTVFSSLGVFSRINIRLSRNWVSTVAPLCRCLLDKLRQSSTHNFEKTLCRLDRHIILGRIMYDMQMIYCTRMYNTDFQEYTTLKCIVRNSRNTLHLNVQCGFLGMHCTRTYNADFLGIHCTRTYNVDF